MRIISILLIIVSMGHLHLDIKKRFFNEKFFPFLTCQCPLQIFYGGASSGKSAFIAQRRVIGICREPRNYLIIRKVSNTIRSSVFSETERAIYAMHLQDYFDITPSLMEIVFKGDGRKMLFRGLDEVSRLQSIIVPKGVLTDIEVDEATEISESDYDKLDLRMRGMAPCTKRFVMSFNPVFRTHWIARRFFNGQWITYKYKKKKILIVHSTHLDNKFLDDQDHEKIEGKTGYVRDVFAKGKWGVLGDLIFTNWSVGDCRDVDFDITRYGLDFGFTNDPSAALKVGVDRKNKNLYIQQEVYIHGATNDVLAAKIKPMVNGNPVWCQCFPYIKRDAGNGNT